MLLVLTKNFFPSFLRREEKNHSFKTISNMQTHYVEANKYMVAQSPNKDLLDELKEDAKESQSFLEFQKNFFFGEMTKERSARLTLLGYVIEPEEGISSLKNLPAGKVFALRQAYTAMKNKFFASIWKEDILPNMDAESFFHFIEKMEAMDLGNHFVPVMYDQVQKFRAHQEEREEMGLQREAGELDEGQDE